MTRTRIKFCGFTREEDAQAAIELGADSLGLVFYEKSKRFVTVEQLGWLKKLPAFVQLTGLFVNADENFVRNVTRSLPIDLLQFHGNESPEFCSQFSQRYVKAVPMQGMDNQQAVEYMKRYSTACGFILDNYGLSDIGGSGEAFNWDNIPANSGFPLTMAGGLHTENVANVIRSVEPYAVDVSSGIEESAGIKCPIKMRAFIEAVNSA